MAAAVVPRAGMRSVTELVAAAKAKPGRINFGSAGVGGATHMVAEKFRLAAGIDVVHVPYKGGPEAITDTVAGRISYWFPPLPTALPLVSDGRLLALGISSARRSSLMPDVPTIAEAGMPGFDFKLWFGMWAPARTPVRVIDTLEKDTGRALASPDLQERLRKLGAEPLAMTRAEFAHFVRDEIADSARIIRAAAIKPL